MNSIKTYFPELSNRQLEQYAQLVELYKTWNERINVVSRKDIEQLETHHILHSLAIAKVIRFKPGTSILDVGTGGGLPGIPLAIFFPECKFHLVDSIGKKIRVVTEIANELGLDNVKAEQIRAEKIKAKYDFVVSRAVTAMPQFVAWIRTKFKQEGINSLPNGILALKGGDLEKELANFKRTCSIYPIPNFFEEDFFETKKVIYIQM